MARILMIIAPEDFRDEEYFEPKKAFEAAGYAVVTASLTPGEKTGMLGGTARAEIPIKEAYPRDYDAVVLVGGGGARVYFNDPALHALLRDFFHRGKVTAAICVSPTTLANAGLLRGRRATVWNDQALIKNLREKGAEYTGLPVTVDGLFVTASGPLAARQFGQEVLDAIRSQE